MLRPRLEVIIRPNQIRVRNIDSGQVIDAEGPFSCDHLLADDVDILEHVAHRAFKKVAGSLGFFPHVSISTAGRAIHIVERKVIQDALLNAGASRVFLDPSVPILSEQASTRAAYVERAVRKK